MGGKIRSNLSPIPPNPLITRVLNTKICKNKIVDGVQTSTVNAKSARLPTLVLFGDVAEHVRVDVEADVA
jgi:hypothetical protein